MSVWLLEPTPGEFRLIARRQVLHGRELDRDLPLIDVSHYLYAAYKGGHPVQWFLGRWTKDELMAVLEPPLPRD